MDRGESVEILITREHVIPRVPGSRGGCPIERACAAHFGVHVDFAAAGYTNIHVRHEGKLYYLPFQNTHEARQLALTYDRGEFADVLEMLPFTLNLSVADIF